MPGASLRNAVRRRTHKERGQPQERKKLGLLEKHKDYVLRAKDYNSKKKRLLALQKKAEFRNPEEYYMRMNRETTKGGIASGSGNHGETLSHDMLKVLKTQDLAYINLRNAIDQKKAERLQQSLHLLDSDPVNTHKIFLDSAQDVREFDPVKHFDTVPALVETPYNRVRKETLKTQEVQGTSNRKEVKKAIKLRDAQYQELKARLDRSKKLDNARQHLELERNLSGKGRKRKIKDAEDGKPAVYRWKRERKR